MGSSGSTTSTVYQSSLPEYAEPYYSAMMDRTLAVSEEPYQPYEGDRLASAPRDTRQAYQMTRDLANQGTGYLDTAGAILMDTQDDIDEFFTHYKPDMISAQQINYGNSPSVGNVGMSGQVNSGVFDQNAANFYMSPYQEDVVELQQQDAIEEYERQQAAMDAQAVEAGAFGNDRRYVQDALGQEALSEQLAEIQATGSQAAWEQAQAQFNADRDASLNAQQFNIGTDLTAQQANQQAEMQGRELWGTLEQANQQAALTAGQSNQQADQFAADAFLRAMQSQAEMGQGLANIQGMYDKTYLDRANALLQTGQLQQAQRQAELDLRYSDFVNQRDAERQNLMFLSSILQGVPISANQDVSTYTPYNPYSAAYATAGLTSLFSEPTTP